MDDILAWLNAAPEYRPIPEPWHRQADTTSPSRELSRYRCHKALEIHENPRDTLVDGKRLPVFSRCHCAALIPVDYMECGKCNPDRSPANFGTEPEGMRFAKRIAKTPPPPPKTVTFHKYYRWGGGSHHIQSGTRDGAVCGFHQSLDYDGSPEEYSFDGTGYRITHNPGQHKAELLASGIPVTCQRCLKWLENTWRSIKRGPRSGQVS